MYIACAYMISIEISFHSLDLASRLPHLPTYLRTTPTNCIAIGHLLSFCLKFLKYLAKSRLFLFIFVLFTMQRQIWQVNYKSVHRWCAWGLNPGRQDGRLRKIHCTTVAFQSLINVCLRCNNFELH